MTVDFFWGGLILSFELCLNVGSRFTILLTACVRDRSQSNRKVRKTKGKWVSDDLLWRWQKCQRILPVYSGKQIVKGLLRIFSSNKSFLFKNKIIDVSVNHLLLQIESNNFRDSCIRFYGRKFVMEKSYWKSRNCNVSVEIIHSKEIDWS